MKKIFKLSILCFSLVLILGAVHLVPNHHPVNRDGLVAWFSYRNTGSVSALGTWKDYSGNGNDGTLVSSSYINNSGVNFTANSDYVQTSIGGSIFSGSYTFSAWIYNEIDDDRGILFGNYLSGTASDDVSFEIYSTNALRIYYKVAAEPSGTSFTGTTDSIPLQTWTYVVFVRDKDNSKVQLYVNGELDAEENNAWGDMSPVRTMRIGADYRLDYTSFRGKQDDIQLYNRALSTGEIKKLYLKNKRN